jgi:hypothetical protein
MSKEVTLPSGAKVVLKDPSTLRVKDRKNVMRTQIMQQAEILQKHLH